MKTRAAALCLALAFGSPLLAQEGATPAAQAPAKAKAERPKIYDETADARKAIDAALVKAKRENRRVLVQWGANWCGWCHLLSEKFKSDPKIARKLMYEYEVVLVDVAKFDKNMDLAKDLGAELKGNGIPYLTVLGADGKPIANQETGSLESKGAEGEEKSRPSHDSGKVMAFLTKHQAAPLNATEVLADARNRAKAEGKMVMVRWGAPWCGWCHKMDDWLARPEVAALMDKDYVSVKIDQDRMTGGKELLAKEGAGGSTGIPWFAIEEGGTGKVVITSDAPGENGEGRNVGFPFEASEIAHFMVMLEKTSKRLTADDKATLRKTLEEGKAKAEAERARRGGK